MTVIDNWVGPYRFLSNFSPDEVLFEGATYPTAEHAFQAAKAVTPTDRVYVMTSRTPKIAKGRGRELRRDGRERKDWHEVKQGIMDRILRSKFSNPHLAAALVATNPSRLVEGNTWHDNQWGDCYCEACKDIPGTNLLGELLQQIRSDLIEAYETATGKPLVGDI